MPKSEYKWKEDVESIKNRIVISTYLYLSIANNPDC